MEEISELKIIINKLKIEVLKLTNRVLDLEKNKTPPVFGEFSEPWPVVRKSIMCNEGHNLVSGNKYFGRTVLCDVCKQIISVFTLFKSCKVCEYDVCHGCYGDIYPCSNGYSVPITFENPPNSQGWSEFGIPAHNGQTTPPPLNRDPFPLVNTNERGVQFPSVNLGGSGLLHFYG